MAFSVWVNLETKENEDDETDIDIISSGNEIIEILSAEDGKGQQEEG